MAKTLNVTSNTDWNIKADTIPGWLTVSPSSGTGNTDISVSAQSNTGASERIANLIFRITDETIQQTVTVTQAGTPAPTTYALSYTSPGGGVYGGTPAGSYAAGTTITLPTTTESSSTYAFYGFTSAAWSGNKAAGDTFIMPANDVAVVGVFDKGYAYALPSDGYTYTGGSPAGDYASGATMQVPTSAVREGYTLANFQYDIDNASYPVHLGQTFTMPAANITLQANWTKNPTYAIYNDGGTYTGGTAAGSYAAGTTMQVPTSAVRAGYTLANFQYSYMSGGSPSYVAVHLGQTFTMPASNITLQAIWNENPAPSSATVTLENVGTVNLTIGLFNEGDIPKILLPSQYETVFLHPGEDWGIVWNGADDFIVNTIVGNDIMYTSAGKTVWVWIFKNGDWQPNAEFVLSANGNYVMCNYEFSVS
jgi:hypothetical protein